MRVLVSGRWWRGIVELVLNVLIHQTKNVFDILVELLALVGMDGMTTADDDLDTGVNSVGTQVDGRESRGRIYPTVRAVYEPDWYLRVNVDDASDHGRFGETEMGSHVHERLFAATNKSKHNQVWFERHCREMVSLRWIGRVDVVQVVIDELWLLHRVHVLALVVGSEELQKQDAA